jgi:hypothetical protein
MQNNDSKQNERKLKVYSRYFERTIRGVILPEIRLSGKWLHEAGFTCGQDVKVSYEHNKIVITIPGIQEERMAS